MRGSRRWAAVIPMPLALLPLMLALLSAGRAAAHDPFQITTEARLRTRQLDVRIVLSGDTAARLCFAVDAGRSTIDAAPFEGLRPGFEACAPGLYRISAGGEVLIPWRARALLRADNEVELSLVYPRPERSPVLFDAVHLTRLPDPTTSAELTVTGEGKFLGQALLRADRPTLEIDLGDNSVTTTTTSTAGRHPPRAPTPSFGAYLRLGVEHILTGFDHLLFLAGLLVVCHRLSSVLKIVTCFTVAHSLTLALASLDVIALPGRIVEPVIAATIVFVGVENLLRGDEPSGRWVLTFAFGLFHGFGFAGALREIGLGANGAPLAMPLFAFNLGVELGQVAVAAVTLPILWRLRRLTFFAQHGSRAISVVVAGGGLIWLLQRTLSG